MGRGGFANLVVDLFRFDARELNVWAHRGVSWGIARVREDGRREVRATLAERDDCHRKEGVRPVAEGPVAEGPVAEGPVAEGPVAEGVGGASRARPVCGVCSSCGARSAFGGSHRVALGSGWATWGEFVGQVDRWEHRRFGG